MHAATFIHPPFLRIHSTDVILAPAISRDSLMPHLFLSIFPRQINHDKRSFFPGNISESQPSAFSMLEFAPGDSHGFSAICI